MVWKFVTKIPFFNRGGMSVIFFFLMILLSVDQYILKPIVGLAREKQNKSPLHQL